MPDFVICASTNLFRMYLLDRFVTAFLGRLQEHRRKELLVYACFYLVNTALFWEFHTVWINVLCNLTGIGIIVWLHTKSVKTLLFVTCSVYLINAGCDVAAMRPFVNYENGQMDTQIYAVLTVFLIFICELILEKIVTDRKNVEMSIPFALVFVPVCSIGVIVFLTNSDTCSGRDVSVVCFGLLTVNFFMLYLYNLLRQSVSQRYETELLKVQVKVYAHQLDIIRQSEEKIKALRHDMKHHMNELKLLANKYNASEIQEYIDRMEAFICNPNEILDSGNLEIDSVLNYMLQRAKAELENVMVNVMLPEKIRHSFDINVLLGNLLENAIEAARQTEERYLAVDVALKQGVLKVKVENSFRPENVAEEERPGEGRVFLTTKKEKEQHGIGLKSVGKIVEDHNGTMEVTSRNHRFCVRLILYLPEAEA